MVPLKVKNVLINVTFSIPLVDWQQITAHYVTGREKKCWTLFFSYQKDKNAPKMLQK